jgi:hypothetical protein
VKQFINRNIRGIEWVLGVLVVVLPLIAWAGTRSLNNLTVYDVFPPLGLMAFGLMWTHFVMGALRRYAGYDKKGRGLYMTISMGLVLGLIILHPGLLWLQLYRDGFGLPPGSYLTAYKSQEFFVLLGSMGLAIFLSFELKRWFAHRTWWKYIEALQIVGMAAIFFHAMQLGRELKSSWFIVIWWVYGVTLTLAIIYSKLVYKKEVQHGTK